MRRDLVGYEFCGNSLSQLELIVFFFPFFFKLIKIEKNIIKQLVPTRVSGMVRRERPRLAVGLHSGPSAVGSRRHLVYQPLFVVLEVVTDAQLAFKSDRTALGPCTYRNDSLVLTTGAKLNCFKLNSFKVEILRCLKT